MHAGLASSRFTSRFELQKRGKAQETTGTWAFVWSVIDEKSPFFIFFTHISADECK